MSAWTRSSTATALLLASFVVVGAGCPAAAPDDVDLGTLRLALWQPATFDNGVAGDLLDDAEEVRVTLLVDGKERELSLDGTLKAEGGEAAPEGSEVAATVRTTGGTLPNALARSGVVRLEPGGGDVTITAVLAPPDVPYALSSTLPNGRTGMAVCASPDGRVWAIGGLLGSSLAAGSFVLDPVEREVREGPGLDAERAYAACLADDEGGVYLAGGCSVDDQPVRGLSYSATGELGARFVEQRSLVGAGCHTRMTRTSAGTLVVFTGSRLHLIPKEGAPSTITLPSPRFAAVVMAFPGEGEHLLVGGGFSDPSLGSRVGGSLLYDLAAGGGPVQIGERFFAGIHEGDALVVVGESQVSKLSPDGTLETLHTFSLPFGYVPTQLASLRDGRYALLDPTNTALRIVGDRLTRSIALPALREHLVSDNGGALYLFGGGTQGVTVVVIE